MKVSYVEISGFRGYRDTVRIDFADRFTIIDGRNGVGKSTVFDAIEFGLTGALSKYNDQKAAGESVKDYLWWTGSGDAPTSRYVAVGFHDGDTEIEVRRSQLSGPTATDLDRLRHSLCDVRIAPSDPLARLCSATIIRDEHITSLSLDMKEADRYALLRDALGANDSDKYVERAAALLSIAKKRTLLAQQDTARFGSEVSTAVRSIDELRATLSTDAAISESTQRLQHFANSSAPPDQLVSIARERIASTQGRLDGLRSLQHEWHRVDAELARTNALQTALAAARDERNAASSAVQVLAQVDSTESTAESAERARDLTNLVALGRKLGLSGGHCPLCTKPQSHPEYIAALQAVESLAAEINQQASIAANEHLKRVKANELLGISEAKLTAAEKSYSAAMLAVTEFSKTKATFLLSEDATYQTVDAEIAELQQQVDVAANDVRILETIRLSTTLERAQRSESDARARLAKAQERFGHARKVESICQSLYDAARRAASETLDARLERVLPLMSELYRRLRPHPVWDDIDYSIRGDVRRFLKLQVGGNLNPQFLFSSGQRRATGLAFLLSANLSLAWSRWRSILLDDPVQHVDDFRSVHLAELLAQLVSGGRQVICAVEDPALADLLGRRLPVEFHKVAKRVTLGPDGNGVLGVREERSLLPLPAETLVTARHRLAG